MDLKMFTVTQVQRYDAWIQAGKNHDAAGIDDGNLECHVRLQKRLTAQHQSGKVLRISQPALAQVDQGQVDHMDGRMDFFGKYA